MEEKLMRTPAPHIASQTTSAHIMLDVCVALLPALVAAQIIFGVRALVLTLVSVLGCLLFEYLFSLITKRPVTISDLSAVVTGMLIAFCLPVSAPIWLVLIGDFVAIVLVKGLFGGIGKNIANPALCAVILLTLSFPARMRAWVSPLEAVSAGSLVGVPVLEQLARGGYWGTPTLVQMLLGVQEGALGQTCAVALFLGGLYLIIRRVISPAIPLGMTIAVAVTSFFMGINPVLALLSGGVMLGSFFMATDYATSPVSLWGKVIYGVGCGLLTCLFRFCLPGLEGMSFAIVAMNLLCPYLDRLIDVRPLGGARK